MARNGNKQSKHLAECRFLISTLALPGATSLIWCSRITLLVLAIVLLGACSSATPDALAQTVLKQQLADIDASFVLCIAVDSKDPDSVLLASLHEPDRVIVPASECVWVMGAEGSYHQPSGKKAMLVNVAADRSRGEVQYEARYHGKWATYRTLKVSEEQGHWRVIEVLKDERA